MSFTSFVILGEMRTGSNFLQENMARWPGVTVQGEAFNPGFLGRQGVTEAEGWTLARRDADPIGYLAHLRAAPGLTGFRLFGGHDQRIEAALLADPACAKIVLGRNPVEAWVSHRTALATDQWRLTNLARRKAAPRVTFDAEAFRRDWGRQIARRQAILSTLQATGQTAFWLDYRDLPDLGVLRGLALWLGVEPPGQIDRRLKKQNPEALADRVANWDELLAEVGPLDLLDLTGSPVLEPRRGWPSLPVLIAAHGDLLVAVPPSGPRAAMAGWLDRAAGGHETGRPLAWLRTWKSRHPGHATALVLRHPLTRAHHAFVTHLLSPDPAYDGIRSQAARDYGLDLPADLPGDGSGDLPFTLDPARHAAAFAAFLRFLKDNLAGQTPARIDAAWASQVEYAQTLAALSPPDVTLREDGLAVALPGLARARGLDPVAPGPTDPLAPRLAAILTPALQRLSAAAQARDHQAFGFGDWVPPRA